MAKRDFRIFISSPGDVAEERAIALKLIEDLPYDPAWRERITLEAVAWDKKGAPLLATITPQEAVNQGLPLPSACDIVIVIFWSKMGTPLPFPEYRKEKGEPYHSGTDWEYEDAYKSSKATGFPVVIVYRRTEVPSFLPTDPEFMKKYEQWQKVQNFFSGFSEADTGAGLGGYNSYLKPENFKELLDTHLKNILERLLKLPERTSVAPKVEPKKDDQPPKWHGSPFPGLRAFTTSDAPIYFGRGNESDKLMRRVAERGFVAVVGASGSGKSSLVGAGLIPRLKAGGLAGSEDWVLPEFKDGQWIGLRFTPGEVGDNPFMALAAKCGAWHGMKNPQFAEKLEADPQALVRLCIKALEGKPDTAKVLIFIDQFEELFTVVDAKYREMFINMLAAAAVEERLRVVVTIRSDFYDRCVEWQVLTGLLENGSFPVSTPDAFFLKDMIELPAERAGLTFEDGLPAQMVRDTGSDAGALALLAFALDELYKVGELTHKAYEKLGKVEGAIGTRATAIYGDQKPEVREALAEVFGKLVTMTVKDTPTRRRALLADFADESSARQLINALVDARLLVTDGKTVEVAHEALFRKWPTLVEWIAEYKNDLYLIEQVKQAAKVWDENARNYDSYGWKHDRLKPVYEAQKRLNVHLDVVTTNFIQPEAKRLLKIFKKAKDHKRRILIEEDFARLGEDGLEELVEALCFEPEKFIEESEIASSAERILHKYSSRANPILIALLSDDSWLVRQVAIVALRRLGVRTAAEPLIQRLTDEEAIVRQSAAIAVGRLEIKEAVQALIYCLEDASDGVRQAAITAIGIIGTREVIPLLAQHLLDDSPDVRLASIRALGQMEARETIPALMERLLDDTDYVRNAAIIVLGALNATESVEALIHCLKDKKVRVSISAAEALRQISTPEALIAAAKWEEKIQLDLRSKYL